MSDIEGKAATGSSERAGKRPSFKFVSENDLIVPLQLVSPTS